MFPYKRWFGGNAREATRHDSICIGGVNPNPQIKIIMFRKFLNIKTTLSVQISKQYCIRKDEEKSLVLFCWKDGKS